MASGKVANLKFTDLYLGAGHAQAGQVEGADADPLLLSAEYADDARQLYELCLAKSKDYPNGEFRIQYDEVFYRVSLIPSHEIFFVLRRADRIIRKPLELGIHPNIIRHLMSSNLKGLVIACGPYGSGKTSTLSSILAGRLAVHGKTAVTAEDPPELPLHGQHGKGYCYQTEVTQDRGFALACKQMARFAPSIIFLGELRDRESVKESLTAAINGRLVLASTHGSNVPSTLERLCMMAGGGPEIASLMAAGLAGVLHQEVSSRNPFSLKTEFLHIHPGIQGDGPRQLIRDQKFKQLMTEIQAQEARQWN